MRKRNGRRVSRPIDGEMAAPAMLTAAGTVKSRLRAAAAASYWGVDSSPTSGPPMRVGLKTNPPTSLAVGVRP